MKWQAEQLRYPRDADYTGAKTGLFDLSLDAKDIVGEPNAGDAFIYLFRRFGYPRFGWDGDKQLVRYHITTPLAGVMLVVEPNVTGGGTFGYTLRDDIDKACTEEEQKPSRDWGYQCSAWVLKTKGIEILLPFEQNDAKLQRVWKVWAASHEYNEFEDWKACNVAFYTEQANICIEYMDRYESINPRPCLPRVEDRSDDSIMKQCWNALCASIKDMLRPVYKGGAQGGRKLRRFSAEMNSPRTSNERFKYG